jgi:hypothetical protein
MKGVPSKPPLETVAGQHRFQSMPLEICYLYSYPLISLENRGRKLLMILISISLMVLVEPLMNNIYIVHRLQDNTSPGRPLSIPSRENGEGCHVLLS